MNAFYFRVSALGIFLVGALVGYFIYTTQTPGERFSFHLGLDLSGGSQLVYRADTSKVASGELSSSLDALRDVIERRVNLFGVGEPIVQLETSSFVSGANEHRLIVELPGVTDVAEAIARIGETPLLEFKLLRTDVQLPQTPGSEEYSNFDWNSAFSDTGLTGRLVSSAQLQFGNGSSGGLSNEPVVLLNFNGDGTNLFKKITEENIGRVLGIFLDGNLISGPVIREAIPNGTAVISGNFTPDEAKELVKNLNFGALPVPITLIGTQTIGASLGEAALDAGVVAGIVGFLAVVVFMVLWYRLPGLVAGLALVLYVLVMLALFKIIPVTLTAAGLAAFILSVGMAVDANVLIFERVKEELRAGKDLHKAIREGFARAWLSIRDGNLTSIISAIILFWFGTSFIQGFALVFALGVLTSMVTALSVSRTLLLAIGAVPMRGIGRFLFGTGLS